MKTIQLTLEAGLLASVDKAARRLGTTRSAFAREALLAALKPLADAELEQKFRKGYARKPVRKGEFGSWESEQA